jgi:orotate phosphoribosyltransferase
MDKAKIKERIIEEVAKQKSFLVGYFSKPNTPVVIPMWADVSVSNPDFLKFIGEQIAQEVKNIGGCDILCGISTTGISLASATSLASGTPWIFARGERKSYGSKEAFDGRYHGGAKIIFIDNLSAKGKGMLPVFVEADKEGFQYSSMIVIVDYNTWDKIPAFQEKNIQIHSLISTHELVEGLAHKRYFPGRIAEMLIHFIENPQEWTPDSDSVQQFKKELEQHRDVSYIRDETFTAL